MTTIRISAALAIGSLAWAACAPADTRPADERVAGAASHDAAAPASSAGGDARTATSAAASALPDADDFSIYLLDSRWSDRHGSEVALQSLAGRPQVMAMLYTHCAHACPMILGHLKRVEAATPAHVGFVLVSMDPARDTPERLNEFARAARLDPARWTLLTAGEGEEGQVLELAAVLGVQYRPTGGGEFAHANVVTVLDERGVITYQQMGLDDGPRPVIAAIERFSEASQ